MTSKSENEEATPRSKPLVRSHQTRLIGRIMGPSDENGDFAIKLDSGTVMYLQEQAFERLE